METKVLKPVNQKSVYHSYSDLYAKIMNNEIDIDRAAIAEKALSGMNKTYALEVKRAEVEQFIKGNSGKAIIRTVEVKNFDNIPIEEGSESRSELPSKDEQR